jgi:hypothetical protein
MLRGERMIGMPTPADPAEEPTQSLQEFFVDIEAGDGPSLSAEDHRTLAANVRSYRDPSDD